MNRILHRWLNNCKSRIQRRLDKTDLRGCDQTPAHRHQHPLEISNRIQGFNHGGIGDPSPWLHGATPDSLRPSTRDCTFSASTCPYLQGPSPRPEHRLQPSVRRHLACRNIELRRNDQNFLNALGARRIPDPTTRRLLPTLHTRPHLPPARRHQHSVTKAWANQHALFERGHRHGQHPGPATTGACKHGMRTSRTTAPGSPPVDRLPGQHRRSARPGQPAGQPPLARGRSRRGGPRPGLLCFRAASADLARSSFDFSQTEHLDRWDDDPRVRFVFGYVAAPNLKGMAEDLPATGCRCNGRPVADQDTAASQQPDKGQGEHRGGAWFREPAALRSEKWPSSVTGRRPAARSIAWSWCARTSREKGGAAALR